VSVTHVSVGPAAGWAAAAVATVALIACAPGRTAADPVSDTEWISSAEESVTAPPRGWLERHQSADGSWDPDPAAHPCGCLDGDGAATIGRAGATGLALLSFLDQGDTHRSGRHASVVARGLRWLQSTQSAEGCFSGLPGSGRAREHALAALAMAEAYAGTRSPLFRDSARRGVEFALGLRGSEGAWGAGGPADPPDLEITAWMTLLIRSGVDGELVAGLDAFDRVRAWIDGNASLDGSRPGLVLLLHHLCGAGRGDPAVARGRSLAMQAVPRWGGPGPEPDLASAYLGSVAMFGTSAGRPFPSGDPAWEPWYAGLKTLRWPAIPPEDCAAQSYGRGPRRLTDTALATMIEAFGYR